MQRGATEEEAATQLERGRRETLLPEHLATVRIRLGFGFGSEVGLRLRSRVASCNPLLQRTQRMHARGVRTRCT